MRIGVIGGGISGLTAAYYLQKKGHTCVVLEASDRTGGCIQTEKIDGRLLENGPNSLLFSDDHLSLIKELGLEDQLQEAADVNKDRFILRNGKYNVLPSGPLNFFSNKFFGWNTKLKIITEYFRKNKAKSDNESLYDFFERRFNNEVCDYAVDPFVRGIYAGDPKQLKIKASFPSIYNAEKNHGSIIKGMIQLRKENKANGVAVKRKTAYSFKDGIQTLTNALANKVDVSYNSEVESLTIVDDIFSVKTYNDEFLFDKVIICTPPEATSKIVQFLSPKTAEKLEKVFCPPMCVVHSVFSKEASQNTPVGFGGLNPSVEKTFTAGSIWSSCIFPNRTSNDEVLVTSFVGGAHTPENAKLEEGNIKNSVGNELQSTLGFTDQPVYQKTHKWRKAIPQYDQNILNLWETMEKEPIPNLYYSVNWKDGIAVPDCIEKSKKLVEDQF
ncbi:protoporphyrinogen oxidase [Flammeovirga aprica]|uniref:Protoporphyrinogen oxidase n=1 Tax=Flammeovirga aprica JL-4 TaxID=694437 RepID=A0A7X9XC05_9BACT|nr:protoporphyrinogen oxidase [Flammeovirga aprica]NME71291.1 protoporphyrinogen oxidase [Flammeovirga aprica JL-4]